MSWHGRKLARTSVTPGTPETPGPPLPQDSMELRDPQDLWSLRLPGTSGHQHPWNSESKHPETLELKHKQRTFLNYIIGQSQTKVENCAYL